MKLENIVTFLDTNAPAFLATLGNCGNPRLRPFQSPLLYEDKIYFCTSNAKNLYKHIQAHSGIEICSCAADGTFLRLRGNAVFENNLAVKQAMFAKFESVKAKYTTPANPSFEVFYLANLSARKQALNGDIEMYKA